MAGVDLEIELLECVRAEIDAHAEECTQTPKAILLNPGNYELLGWDEILGLPVLPDPRVQPDKAKLLCGEEGWGGEFEGKRVIWHEGCAHQFVADDTVAEDSIAEAAS
jgi:hypothetical protein